ncbi:hypothetical protein H6F86_29470 [Phormidium sp. FACHB-592]|nr:hypothetical protein [Phormidium sp. FACHB-592]
MPLFPAIALYKRLEAGAVRSVFRLQDCVSNERPGTGDYKKCLIGTSTSFGAGEESFQRAPQYGRRKAQI